MIAQKTNGAAQNLHICMRLQEALTAIDKLVGMGITPLKVSIEGRNPLIEVQDTPACNALPSAVMKTTINRTGVHTHKVCLVHGCQVQWQTTRQHH